MTLSLKDPAVQRAIGQIIIAAKSPPFAQQWLRDPAAALDSLNIPPAIKATLQANISAAGIPPAESLTWLTSLG